MDEQAVVDIEFLQQLETSYQREVLITEARMLDIQSELNKFSPPDDPSRLMRKYEELKNQLQSLQTELAQTRQQQQALFATAQKTSGDIRVDCNHWLQLLNIHTKVIYALELQQAQLGTEFHYSKQIELDERNERVAELRNIIALNCNQELNQ